MERLEAIFQKPEEVKFARMLLGRVTQSKIPGNLKRLLLDVQTDRSQDEPYRPLNPFFVVEQLIKKGYLAMQDYSGIGVINSIYVSMVQEANTFFESAYPG